MGEKAEKICCINTLGTAPPVPASKTFAEEIACTDEEKHAYAGLVVPRGIKF